MKLFKRSALFVFDVGLRIGAVVAWAELTLFALFFIFYIFPLAVELLFFAGSLIFG